MVGHNLVYLQRQLVGCAAPGPQRSEVQSNTCLFQAVQLYGVAMRDAVAGRIEVLEVTLSSDVSGVLRVERVPQADTEPAEVRAERAGMWVPRVQASSFGQQDLQHVGDLWVEGCDLMPHEGGGLIMQVPSEALELSGKSQDQGKI